MQVYGCTRGHGYPDNNCGPGTAACSGENMVVTLGLRPETCQALSSAFLTVEQASCGGVEGARGCGGSGDLTPACGGVLGGLLPRASQGFLQFDEEFWRGLPASVGVLCCRVMEMETLRQNVPGWKTPPVASLTH